MVLEDKPIIYGKKQGKWNKALTFDHHPPSSATSGSNPGSLAVMTWPGNPVTTCQLSGEGERERERYIYIYIVMPELPSSYLT